MSKMTIRKPAAAGVLALGMMGLAACSGGSSGTQDVGDQGATSSSRTFHARAIDGYLAGAVVYVDLNENNRLDAFEPRAITDNDGYFSYNHDTDTDYCAPGGLSQHCLRGNVGADEEVIIRVTGGYDTVTQLPFKGVLSLRSSQLDRDDMRVVTPVTSMVADTAEGAQEAKLQELTAAGVFDGNPDPMQADAPYMTRQQVAAIIARLTGEAGKLAYPDTFEDLTADAWASGYLAIASELGAGTTFETAYTVPANVESLVHDVVFSVTRPGEQKPADFTLPNADTIRQMSEHIARLVALNEDMVAALENRTASLEEGLAMLRLQQVMAERAFAHPFDPELQDLETWVRNQLAQGDGLGADLTALGGENIDLGVLTASHFDFDPASNSISASATIPAEAATTFAALVNTSFGLEVNQPDEQGAALFFVSGDAGARSGKIDVCVRYRGDDGDFDTTSSSDPNGALAIGGRWSLLDDHTLTLSVELVGGVRSLLLKAVGANMVGGQSMRNYRFDFGGELSEWSGSAPSAFAPGAVPASDAACRDALIERFGSMS